MPLTGLIGGKILCMHGGLSPHLESIDQLREMPRSPAVSTPGLALDLLWSDPDQYVTGTNDNKKIGVNEEI